MNIIEAQQALQDGKRVRDTQNADEVFLVYDNTISWTEYSTSPVHFNDNTMSPDYFELIEPEKIYYRLQDGEFELISKSQYEFHTRYCELLTTPFNNVGNDDTLQMFKTQLGHFEIFKVVEKE